QRHDAVVAQGVENGDVAVHGNDPQEGEGRHDGAADEQVDDIVHSVDDAGARDQHAMLQQQQEEHLDQVADAHQHVGDGQAADEVIRGVPVLQEGGHHQQVLHQAHQPQRQEQLVGDVEPLAPGVAGPGRGVALVALAGIPGLTQPVQRGQYRH
ncbi:hypothetical protein N320_08467, partial [Buceros rhinoceros silvestris]